MLQLRGEVYAHSAQLALVLVRAECKKYFGDRKYEILWIETEKWATIDGKETFYGKTTYYAESVEEEDGT